MTHDGRVEAMITIPTGGLAISATNGAGGPSTVTVPAASYWYTAVALSSIITELQTQLNASRPSGWTVSISTGASGTYKVTINCSSTPWSITWTSTVLRDLLGFTANISGVSSAQTGANQARGIWAPDCPMDIDGETALAPIDSDLRSTRSPTGAVYTVVGNYFYRARNVRWSHVPRSRFRAAAATTTNAAWETFLYDTQLNKIPTGSSDLTSIFKAAAPVQIYDHGGTRLGSDVIANGWSLIGLKALQPQRADKNFTGWYRVELPELLSDG
jgi:hypothetical protein